MSWNRTLVALACVVATGCYDSRLLYDSGAPPAVDASAPIDTGTPPPPPPPPPTDQLDLLFLVDNSGSMTEEQASLAAALPQLMTELATHYTSIQAGVITSDMGVGGFTVPTCVNRDFGDDGLLRTQGQTADPDCMATYPRFLTWQAGGSLSSADFASQLGCVAVAGNGGCGFEQQLEAVLKAVTPTGAQPWTADGFAAIGTPGASDGRDIPFFRMTSGHGNVANDGFVRPDSMLAIVLVTDEEDCSALDLNLFDPMSPTYSSTDLNLRCFAHPAALHPVSRYVSGLLQLRRHPSRLAYFLIGGVPVDLVPAPGEPVDWDRLVSPDLSVRDDRMEERVDPSMPNRLVPSCNVPGRGVSFAPVRMVQTAQELERLGARASVGSICQESFHETLVSFVDVLTR